MNKENKKISITQIVVVVVFIAVLAVVLVPTYLSLAKKASISTDSEIAMRMNEIIATDTTFENIKDVVQTLNQSGYGIEKLNPTKDASRYVWDKTSQQILLLNKNFEVVETSTARPYDKSTWELWLTATTPAQIVSTDKFQINYYIAEASSENFVFQNISNVYLGSNTFSGNLNFGTPDSAITAAGTIKLFGNITGKLFLNMPNASFQHTGNINEIEINQVKQNGTTSFNGLINKIFVNSGFLSIEPLSFVKKLIFSSLSSAQVANKAVIGEVKMLNIAGQEIADLPEINSLNNLGFVQNAKNISALINNSNFAVQISNIAQLERFRDYVNSGVTYKGVTVKLTSDITLNDGWTPIGEFARDREMQQTTNSFSGIFDGNNKTIRNLNNKGYKPSSVALFENEATIAGKKEFVYGFFGVVTNATIKNLNLSGVNININESGEYYGNSVGALVGYSAGSLLIDNVKVIDASKIYAYDAVGGLVGRAYAYANTNTEPQAAPTLNLPTNVPVTNITIINCENIATVVATKNAAGIIGEVNCFGIKEASEFVVEIKNCLNSNSITATQNVSAIISVLNLGKYLITNNTNSGSLTLNQPSSLNKPQTHVGVSFAWAVSSENLNFALTATSNNNFGTIKNGNEIVVNPNLNLTIDNTPEPQPELNPEPNPES